MNKINIQAIEHRIDSNMAYPLDEKRFVVSIRFSRYDDIQNVCVLYGDKYLFPFQRGKALLKKKYTDSMFSYFQATLELPSPRLAYVFSFQSKEGTFFFSESGATKTYDFAKAYYDFFQFPFINDADLIKVPEWCYSAVFYEIFVDRFFSEGKNGKKVDLQIGERPKPKSQGGGNLQGITSKLDYLSSLGVNSLYLTPIFLSPTNHKYDTEDYFVIDPDFGNEEDLKGLVLKAHKKGMHIILDAVFNHCSERNAKFQDALKRGKESPYFDWFIVHGDKICQNPPNYEMFASCSYMPKINTNNEEVRKQLIKIALHYIKHFDIDGWRLDVSDEVSHLFWREFRQAVKKEKPEAIIIGENWHISENYLGGDQFDSVMNYPFSKIALDCFGPNRVGAESTSERLNSLLVRYPMPVNFMMLNLLDSHDSVRFYSDMLNNKDATAAAWALTMVYVGMPCLYYGDEIPLSGGGDPDNRRLFPWGKQLDSSFYEIIKSLIKIRKIETIQKGEIEVASEGGLLLIRRNNRGESFLLAINVGDKALSYERKSTLIASNLYADKTIEPNGFVFQKEE